MNEIGMELKALFTLRQIPSNCEPVILNKFSTSKIQWLDTHGLDISFQKGKNRKEDRNNRSQASSKPNRRNKTTF